MVKFLGPFILVHHDFAKTAAVSIAQSVSVLETCFLKLMTQ